MIVLSKLFQHFPKPYLLILIFLLLVMRIIVLWSDYDEPISANTSQTLDLSLKLPVESSQTPVQPKTKAKVENWSSVTVKSGDSLSTLFQRVGLSARDVYRVTQATKKSNSLRTLFPGDTLDFVINAGQLQKVRLIKSPLQQIIITRQEQGPYKVETITRQPDIETLFIQGAISNSLFLDGQRAGLSQKKLMELTNIFGW